MHIVLYDPCREARDINEARVGEVFDRRYFKELALKDIKIAFAEYARTLINAANEREALLKKEGVTASDIENLPSLYQLTNENFERCLRTIWIRYLEYCKEEGSITRAHISVPESLSRSLMEKCAAFSVGAQRDTEGVYKEIEHYMYRWDFLLDKYIDNAKRGRVDGQLIYQQRAMAPSQMGLLAVVAAHPIVSLLVAGATIAGTVITALAYYFGTGVAG